MIVLVLKYIYLKKLKKLKLLSAAIKTDLKTKIFLSSTATNMSLAISETIIYPFIFSVYLIDLL